MLVMNFNRLTQPDARFNPERDVRNLPRRIPKTRAPSQHLLSLRAVLPPSLPSLPSVQIVPERIRASFCLTTDSPFVISVLYRGNPPDLGPPPPLRFQPGKPFFLSVYSAYSVVSSLVSCFCGLLLFGFVSDFGFRISDFRLRRSASVVQNPAFPAPKLFSIIFWVGRFLSHPLCYL